MIRVLGISALVAIALAMPMQEAAAVERPLVRSSVGPLVPLSVQKGSRGRVVTVITRMLVINSSPTERGSLFRLSIARSHRRMLKTASA